MKHISGWGLTADSWKGERGEYWVVAQAGLMLGFVLLPVYRPLRLAPNLATYGCRTVAVLLLAGAVVLVVKGLLDLGSNLTPLPYPRADGQFVQSGSYGLVRHPLYGGVILAALAYAIGQLSLSHLGGAALLLLFFDQKATLEEAWLEAKYSDYGSYRQRVKKLIPGLY